MAESTWEQRTKALNEAGYARNDAFLYIDETQALHPLGTRTREDREPPETFPSWE